jgi:thiosulfate/3-mercaptopyruvate sulfurtransferase
LNGLADVAAWQAWIAPLGLSADTEVIIYGSGQQLEPARAWWLLRYLGVQNVALVDGNFTLWETEKRPLTNLTTLVRPGTFTIKIHRDRLANREDVLAVLENKSARIIDARSLAEFTGADAKSKRAGHIPEACHLEWTQLVSQDGKFLKLSELSARLAKAGVKPGEAVITHCQGGGRASVDAFVFEHLGHSTRNYYLGWSDWGNIADTPVATESKTNPKR